MLRYLRAALSAPVADGATPLMDALADVVQELWLRLEESSSPEDAAVDLLVQRLIGGGAAEMT